MSADNGIYIRETPEGDYWIAHLHCSVVEDEEKSEEKVDEMFRKKYKGVNYPAHPDPYGCYKAVSKQTALDVAKRMANQIHVLEYGIVELSREEQ